jgi:hypothetical protein
VQRLQLAEGRELQAQAAGHVARQGDVGDQAVPVVPSRRMLPSSPGMPISRRLTCLRAA